VARWHDRIGQLQAALTQTPLTQAMMVWMRTLLRHHLSCHASERWLDYIICAIL